jgi:ATP-dependent Lon protease
MTGELSLTGRVLPIGGVREKLLAARRSGIDRVLLPKENQRDLHELPIELLRSLDIRFVSHINEVLPLVLQGKPGRGTKGIRAKKPLRRKTLRPARSKRPALKTGIKTAIHPAKKIRNKRGPGVN